MGHLDPMKMLDGRDRLSAAECLAPDRHRSFTVDRDLPFCDPAHECVRKPAVARSGADDILSRFASAAKAQ
ncbi:MAG: hypothetical protein CL908_00920 [Deltaproteobacteria bacterium]|nr:hypothetical protein [Deltaproteobacteria bacterium]